MNRPPAEDREALLATAVRKAVQSTEAYGCLVYLRSHDRRALLLSTVTGVPLSLLSAFRTVPMSAPLPVAAAFRTGRTVSLSGAEETMRRFPQLLVGLPYSFATVCVPVTAGAERFGVLAALWPGSAQAIAPGARRHLRTIANRLGAALRAGEPLLGPAESDGATTEVELPAPGGPALAVGLFDWNLGTDAFSADGRALTILGLTPDGFDGRATEAGSRLHPDDLPEFLAAAETARVHGRVRALHLRVLREDGGARTVELWGRIPQAAPGDHLVGVLLDTQAGAAALGAVERLRHGVFSLAPDGRVSYANRSTEMLLGAQREDLLGQRPWEALPWLGDPTYEDRYRAAMLSQQPTSFLACRPPDHWLAFALYPDAHGVTGTVLPATPPDRPPAPAPGEPVAPRAPASLGAIYHLLQLASVLTQAVTVQQVCDCVAEQILPAFAGQQLAIYLVREGRLHLTRQVGYPEGFLDRFEGTPMRNVKLPGVETLNSGIPIFFESAEELSTAYPGIPLDEMASWAFLPLIASGHPVGSCILGFERARAFTPEDRAVLTALGGLIAQALERARLYDTEFALARGLQQALLPHRLPEVPGLTIAARYLPGTRGMEIGGDWYDAIPTGQGLCLVIGDVEGHSVAAAATMGQLRSAVRAFVICGGRPDEVLRRTNQLLADLDPGLLASCCLVALDPADGQAHAVRAGHLPPLLRHPDGHTEVLDLEGGPLLGVDQRAAFPISTFRLPPGGVLALYTDGLVEQAGEQIDRGVDRLRVSLAHAEAGSLEELADRLVGAARRSAHRLDDVALLLTRTSSRLPAERQAPEQPAAPQAEHRADGP